MAGVDLNRNPAPVETKERRPAPVKRERAGARAGDRQREGTGAIAGTPKRTNALWFFVALLGGGAGVWWTKSAFSNAWIAATVAAGVVLALIAYYMLNDEDAPEEEGDNVYYLGLLFTLISLMFTLVELFGSDTDAVRNVEKIRVLLENFGIALTSTIVGIAAGSQCRTGNEPGLREDQNLPRTRRSRRSRLRAQPPGTSRGSTDSSSRGSPAISSEAQTRSRGFTEWSEAMPATPKAICVATVKR